MAPFGRGPPIRVFIGVFRVCTGAQGVHGRTGCARVHRMWRPVDWCVWVRALASESSSSRTAGGPHSAARRRG